MFRPRTLLLPKSRRFEQILVVCAVFASFHFTISHIRNSTPFLNLQDYVAGNAPLPYQARALMAWLANLCSTQLDLDRFAQSVSRELADTSLLTFFLVEAASVFGTFFFLRRHLILTTASTAFSTLGAFSLFWILPFHYILPPIQNFYLPSDLPSVFLFTMGLYWMRVGRTLPFYLTFILGAFNRETICFLTVAFVAYNSRRMERGKLLLHAVIQLALWGCAKIFLLNLYSANEQDVTMGVFALTGVSNLYYLIRIQHYPTLFSAFGFTWVFLGFLWRGVRDSFARSLLWVIPPFVLTMFLVGALIELRIFGELIPVLVILVWTCFHENLPDTESV